MSIEKHVATTWQVENVLDSPSKVACWQPPTYVPPEIQSFMSQLKERGADPRFSYVHLIAMTDGDYYGQNLNGDVFGTSELTGIQSEQEAAKNVGHMRGICVPRYKTFEQAKFFRNHANGENDPYYGDVPCAAWNDPMRRVELIIRIAKKAVPEMGIQDGGDITIKLDRRGFITVSMGCFTDPATLIRVRQGYKRIDAIAVGDEVFTHEGRWKKVTRLHRRRYTGRVRSIHTMGFPLPIEVTENHPWWATHLADLADANGRTDAAFRTLVKHANGHTSERMGHVAVAVSEEGGRTGWMHASHLEVNDRLYSRPVVFEPNRYCALADKDLARIMGFYLAEGSLCGGEAPLAAEFACNVLDDLPRVLPELMQRKFPDVTCKLEGHAKSEVGLKVTVFSANLARFLEKYIGRRCENKQIPPEVFVADHDIRVAFLAAWLSGDGWADTKGVHWSSANLGLVLAGRDLLASVGVDASIYRILHKEGSGFNFHDTVEYTLNITLRDALPLIPYAERKLADLPVLAATQKLNKGVSVKTVGDKQAFRIKSIEDREVTDQTVYNFDVEGDESYSAYGFISHNCRISHEQCSICGNTNEFIHERCEHLANQMNDVLPDGRVVSAKNFGMRFFDLSDVGVPADPGAYSLAKVASPDGSTHLLPNVAFDADGYAEWRTKHSEMTKHVPCADPIADLLPQADPSGHTTKKLAEYSVDELKKAVYASGEDLDTVLSTAAAAGIVFSPTELCTLTALTEPDKMASASFRGFRTITFDKVSRPVYDALRSKFAVRSGFVAPSYARGWEPAKLAEEGHTVVADYYAFYRDALRSLSRSTFVKAAHRLPYLREVVDAGGDPKAAMNNLAYAGILP